MTARIDARAPHADWAAATIADVDARVLLSTVIEPGDVTMGRLLTWHSPQTIARALLTGDYTGMENAVGDPGEVRLIHTPTGIRELVPLSGAEWNSALDRWQPRVNSEHWQNLLDRLTDDGPIRLLTPNSPFWPQGLRDLGVHAPIILYVLGEIQPLHDAASRSIAIVGARAATSYGEHVTATIVPDLVEREYAIVSGGAYGIDGTAHRAAIAAGGITIAVLAGGVDRLYPVGHEQLLRRVADTGAVISELPPGAAPTRWRFLQRNRIIAALAQGTVVVEAGVRSGSLNTARHAASLGRKLMAVPGPVTSPASEGTRRLIREFDADAVGNATEIVDTLHGITP